MKNLPKLRPIVSARPVDLKRSNQDFVCIIEKATLHCDLPHQAHRNRIVRRHREMSAKSNLCAFGAALAQQIRRGLDFGRSTGQLIMSRILRLGGNASDEIAKLKRCGLVLWIVRDPLPCQPMGRARIAGSQDFNHFLRHIKCLDARLKSRQPR